MGRAGSNRPCVFAEMMETLTHMETLLGLGPISSVLKVVVNDIEIPIATPGQDMTTTGWYSIVSTGSRQGAFNMDFVDSSGNPLGDPHGSIASLSIVVPNRISTGHLHPLFRFDAGNPGGHVRQLTEARKALSFPIIRLGSFSISYGVAGGIWQISIFQHLPASASFCATLIR